jgi:excinuclease UvrABC ATPase subunit
MLVVRPADWIIDLGPEGGSKGGRVVFEGTPTSLLEASQSLTSRYLQPSRPSKADRVPVTRS